MTTTTARHVRVQRTSSATLVAAWAVPVFVLGQFALISGLPLAVALVGTWRDARLRPLRWWTAALAAGYVVPLVLWRVGSGDVPSLSKYLGPVYTGVFVAAGVALALAHHVVRRRSGNA